MTGGFGMNSFGDQAFRLFWRWVDRMNVCVLSCGVFLVCGMRQRGCSSGIDFGLQRPGLINSSVIFSNSLLPNPDSPDVYFNS